MTGVRSTEPDVDIDIASLFVSLWRNKGKILVGSLVAAGLAYGATLTVTEKYSASARVFMQKQQSEYTRPNQERLGLNPDVDQLGVKSQVEIIPAAEVLSKVAFDPEFNNNLDKLPEFDPAKRISGLDSFLILLSLKNDPRMTEERVRVVAEMRDKLKVYSVEESRTLVVEFSSSDRALAAKISNDIAAAYLQLLGEDKGRSDIDAIKKLESRSRCERQNLKSRNIALSPTF
jgi:uncharacterized protein involved in exopolysaccharide biosynthesis